MKQTLKRLLFILILSITLTIILYKTNNSTKTPQSINYKYKYDSLIWYDSDISNHIRRDFGIDTTTKTQYKQFKLNYNETSNRNKR